MPLDDGVVDYADRVRKFFYRRAFLAEQMCDENNAGCTSRVTITGDPEELSPSDWEPLENLYYESRIISLVAIEALAAFWEWIEVVPSGQSYDGRYEARFSAFLKHLRFDDRLPRVCTPMLTYTLEQLALEDHFRSVVFERWVRQVDDHISHPVQKDPSIDDLLALYAECTREARQPAHKTIKKRDGNISSILERFQYSALIYKYFRNSIVHEYRASRYTSSFARGTEIMVPILSGYLIVSASPEGEPVTKVEKLIDGPIPQLDIGLGFLTRAVRVGADYVHQLMLAHNTKDVPYSAALIPLKPEVKI